LTQPSFYFGEGFWQKIPHEEFVQSRLYLDLVPCREDETIKTKAKAVNSTSIIACKGWYQGNPNPYIDPIALSVGKRTQVIEKIGKEERDITEGFYTCDRRNKKPS